MKSTKLFYLMSFMVSLLNVANAQNWLWAKSAGGSDNDLADLKNLCLDDNGNSYHSGTFYSNPCYFPTDTLLPNGLYDYYVAKYDINGNELWVKRFGGYNPTAQQQEQINSINYSSINNSIIISGSYYGTGIFGNDTLTGNPGGGFIASMNTNGGFNWVKQARGGISNVDEMGTIYAQFFLSVPQLIDTFLASAGIWMVKYNSSGKFLHARKIFNASGSGYDALLASFKINNGKIYAIGSCSISPFTVDTILVNATPQQYFITCFDTSGSVIWAKPCSGPNSHLISDIVVDRKGNSFIAGPFDNFAAFGQDTLFTHPGLSSDIFVAKYDSLGNNIWAHQGYSTYDYNYYFNLTLDNNNGIYSIGYMKDSVIFGNDTIVSSTNGDMFIARYDSAGSCMAVRHISGIAAHSIVCDNNGDIYMAGSFLSTVNLGTISLTSLGLNDIFIAKSDAIIGVGEIGERKSNQLLIFANPTTGICNIAIPDEFNHESNLLLQIFNSDGKLIQQTKVEIQQEKIKLNLEEEAKGVYDIILSNKSKAYKGKIVFE